MSEDGDGLRLAKNATARRKGLQLRSVRPYEWTQEKMRIFLETLAATANVSASARAAGMHPHAPYKLRQRDAAFGQAWEQALDEGYDRLEGMMMERAMNGTTETITREGITIEKHSFPDHVAFNLLRLHRKSVAERRERKAATRDPGEVIAVIRERLLTIHARTGEE